jgi:hypothetical protein
MHGGYFKDLEEELPCDSDSLVDTLGKLTWNAILKGLPAGTVDGSLEFIMPSTYIRRKLVTAAHISCSLEMDEDGEPNLSRFPKLDISLRSIPAASDADLNNQAGNV